MRFSFHALSCTLLHMSSAAHELPPAREPGAALAHTPEEAAVIIGGTCKAYLLRKLARERVIDCLRIGGAINFTDAHIRQAVAYFEVPARPARAATRPAAKREPADGAPVFPVPAGVTQLRARPSRAR